MSDPDPFLRTQRELESRRPFGDAINRIGHDGSGADLRVGLTPGAQRVEGEGSVEIGHGVSVGGGGFWERMKGLVPNYGIFAGLSWRPKQKEKP